MLSRRATGTSQYASAKDEAVEWDMVQLNHVGVVGTEKQEPLACVPRAVRGMHGARRRMKTVIVTVFEAAGLTVSEIKTVDKAAMNPGPDNPRTTARHQSSSQEV